MLELTTWIDRPLDDIAKTKLFKQFFSATGPERMEGGDTFYLNNDNEGIDVIFSERLL
jgi:hypothetical protein